MKEQYLIYLLAQKDRMKFIYFRIYSLQKKLKLQEISNHLFLAGIVEKWKKFDRKQFLMFLLTH